MAKYAGVIIVLFCCFYQAVGQQQKRVQQLDSPRISQSQKPDQDVVRYEADVLKKGKNDQDEFNILTGNVILNHQNTVIYCDSAYFFQSRNYTEVFGHVRIIDNDSVTITGKKGSYDGDTKLAEIREDVVYQADSVTLYTDNLDYDLNEKTAYYFSGGRIVDGINDLVSDIGFYQTIPKVMSFKHDVILINPEYTMETDTMVYYTLSKLATTFGPTVITTYDGVTVVSEGGDFITNRSITKFYRGTVETPSYIMSGDELFLDDQKQFYTATENVKLISKNENIIITGKNAKYWKDRGVTKIYGNPVMKKYLDPDTMYLSADTLISIEDSLVVNERLLAFHDVRIFHKSMQGLADSLAYFKADSVIELYRDPILWNEGSQIEADSINMLIRNNALDRMNMTSNSFVITQDTLLSFKESEGIVAQFFYNQIKGRDMITYFKENLIRQVDVFGNGESIYFGAEGDTLMIAVNKIVCSDMRMLFEENQLTDVYFYSNPLGNVIPPHELVDADLYLVGFIWRGMERPSLEEVLVRSSRDKKEEETVEGPDSQEPAEIPIEP